VLGVSVVRLSEYLLTTKTTKKRIHRRDTAPVTEDRGLGTVVTRTSVVVHLNFFNDLTKQRCSRLSALSVSAVSPGFNVWNHWNIWNDWNKRQ
jgi:hypothetical protein